MASGKESFFKGLFALDQHPEDAEDKGRAESQRLLEGIKQNPAHNDDTCGDKAAVSQAEARKPGIYTSFTYFQRIPPSRVPNEQDINTVMASHSSTKENHPSSPPDNTIAGNDVSKLANLKQFAAIPRAIGKRKRPGAIEMVHESRRIFNNLVFYFFPNDDIHPGRRMKISKALEYGAIWLKDWRDGITHVIVDNTMSYDQLLKFLKITSVPDDVIVVNENYLPDCISFRLLLDPKQLHYRVKGYQIKPPEPEKMNHKVTESEKPPVPLIRDREENMALPPTDEDFARASGGENSHAQSLQYNDELAQVIDQTKALRNLPLDSEDDSSDAMLSDADSDNERQTKKRKPSSAEPWQEAFQCMRKHDGKTQIENPNARTIEILSEMGQYYDQVQDQWRTLAYRKAIASLRKYPHKVSTKEEAVLIPCIGESLATKIEEIVYTNKLRRLDNARLDPRDQYLQVFLKIYGVGFSQASKWVNQGLKNLLDLLEHAKLTESQKVGIAHYEDFQVRIPRTEVEQHGDIVRKALQSVDAEIEVTIMGSYRRGAADSGDIDLIITKPNAPMTYLRSILIDTVVPQLTTSGFLKVGLSVSHKDTGSKWHGASVLPDSLIWRRIDLLLVPWEEMGAALIYFTGNDIFNRSIRLLASKKGMRLNQHGLFKDVMRSRGRDKITEGTLVEGRSERKIFEILGVPYRPPEHRIC